MQQVVDVAIPAQSIRAREGVVGHALDLERPEAGVAAPAHQLGRADEARVVVRSLGQQLEQVLGADDREQVGLRVAIDRRKERLSARF